MKNKRATFRNKIGQIFIKNNLRTDQRAINQLVKLFESTKRKKKKKERSLEDILKYVHPKHHKLYTKETL